MDYFEAEEGIDYIGSHNGFDNVLNDFDDMHYLN